MSDGTVPEQSQRYPYFFGSLSLIFLVGSSVPYDLSLVVHTVYPSLHTQFVAVGRWRDD